MSYCSYYQAHINISKTWFFAATLRSFEHLAFDRTIDAQKGVFEFFVPKDLEEYFIQFMDYMSEKGIVSNFKKLPNRLAEPGSIV